MQLGEGELAVSLGMLSLQVLDRILSEGYQQSVRSNSEVQWELLRSAWKLLRPVLKASVQHGASTRLMVICNPRPRRYLGILHLHFEFAGRARSRGILDAISVPSAAM